MVTLNPNALIVLGKSALNTIEPILIDSSRRLVAVFVGSEGATVKQNATGALVAEVQGSEDLAIKQKASTGEMVAVIQGDQGADVSQDASGALISKIQGSEDIAIKQKASTGEMIAEMQGSEGVAVKQEATGELISVMQGSQNADILQDATGALVSLMKGLYGATPTTIAVDLNGNMVAVMKGEYGGNLETVALDSDHAIKAVLYDPVDDWNEIQTIGLNELATRLGSKQHFDNRGRQIWIDSFENTNIQWNSVLVGGGTVAKSTAQSWSSNNSLLFSTPATSPSSAHINKTFYNPSTGRYGFEFTWSCNAASFDYFTIVVQIFDGSDKYSGEIRFNGTTKRYEYSWGFGAWTAVGPVFTSTGDLNFWHKFKYVIDIENNKYIRLLVDGNEINMSGLSLWGGASATTSRIWVGLTLQGNGATAYQFAIDDFIFSHLES